MNRHRLLFQRVPPLSTAQPGPGPTRGHPPTATCRPPRRRRGAAPSTAQCAAPPPPAKNVPHVATPHSAPKSIRALGSTRPRTKHDARPTSPSSIWAETPAKAQKIESVIYPSKTGISRSSSTSIHFSCISSSLCNMERNIRKYKQNLFLDPKQIVEVAIAVAVAL